jgi:L-alanine-DL-glutamate epimerase-like enolase superfamily enzyme
MKITGFETIRLGEFPNLLWLHIHTDEGLIGLGETFFGPRAVEAHIHETVAPLLLGKPALQMDRHGRTLQNQYLGFSGSGVEMRAASAVDIALWDLFGQAVGKPLYECLGGLSHDKVRIYNTCAGYRYIRAEGGQKTGNWGVDAASAAGPYEDLDAFLNRADELAQSLLEQGITAMKIWPFDFAAEASEGRSISAAELDAALVPFRKIRAAVGRKMDIMAELHSLWTPPAAEVVLRALAEFQPFWAEDPIKMTNADLLASLRARTGVPICASETLATRRAFREFLTADAVDVVMLDLSWCGGIGEAKKIATLAEAWGRPVAPHDCTGPVVLTASVHLSLNCPNTLIQETVRAFTSGWYREVLTELPDIRNGFAYPMTGVGLGTRMQPERLSAADCERRMTKV